MGLQHPHSLSLLYLTEFMEFNGTIIVLILKELFHDFVTTIKKIKRKKESFFSIGVASFLIMPGFCNRLLNRMGKPYSTVNNLHVLFSLTNPDFEEYLHQYFTESKQYFLYRKFYSFSISQHKAFI